MRNLPTELREFVAEITGGAHAGEPWSVRGVHIVQEGLDLLGAAIAALDETNKQADLAALGGDVAAAAMQVAEHFLAGKPLKLQTAKTAIGWVVPTAVMGLGVYSPQFESAKQKLLAIATAGEGTFAGLRKALGG